jgi:hypothetical protein
LLQLSPLQLSYYCNCLTAIFVCAIVSASPFTHGTHGATDRVATSTAAQWGNGATAINQLQWHCVTGAGATGATVTAMIAMAIDRIQQWRWRRSCVLQRQRRRRRNGDPGRSNRSNFNGTGELETVNKEFLDAKIHDDNKTERETQKSMMTIKRKERQ